jgi:polysaccharide biosynthesis protein PslG
MRLNFGNAVGIGLLLLAAFPAFPAPQALQSKPPVVLQSPQKGVPGAKLPLVPPQSPQKGGPGPAPPPTSLTALKPLVPAPPPDRLLYGIEVAWEDMFRGANEHQDVARAQRMLELMRLIGVTNTRLRISWADVEATRGRYDWRRTDRLVNLLKSHGLVLTCLIDGTPTWATGPGSLPIFTAELGRFAAALGNRYKVNIHRWEFWHHPDEIGLSSGNASPTTSIMSDPTVYARLLRVFTANIKRADPTCLVGAGLVGAGGVRGGDAGGALNRLYGGGAKDAFDAVCLDLSGERGLQPLDALDSSTQAVRQTLHAHGDDRKKLWITSWGWATYPETPTGIVAGEQAKRVTAMFAAMRRNPDIEMACLQTLNDWLPVRSDPLSLVGTGLLTRDLLAKPALSAFAVAAQHLIPAPVRLRQVGPLAAIPLPMQAGAASIDIDAGNIIGRVPVLWRGLKIVGTDRHMLSTAQWKDLSAGLAANNAPLLRLIPLRPSLVSMAADGTPVIAWDDADATLLAAARYGSIMLALSAPPGLPDATWRTIVTAFARRYGTTARYNVVRWELNADQNDVADRYPTFAAAIRAALPSARLGVNLRDADPLPAVRLLIPALRKSHATLDHIGWPVMPEASPVETAQTVRQLRALFGSYSPLRKAILLPDVRPMNSDPARDDPAHWVVMADRLLDFAPPDAADGLFGTLVASSSLLISPLNSQMNSAMPSQGERPTTAWQAMTVVNSLVGARLQAVEDDSGVRCLATRTTAGLNVLLWCDPTAALPTDHPGDRPVVVRLRNLPPSVPGGWRIARRLVAPNPLQGSGKGDALDGGQQFTLAALLPFETDIAAGDIELPIMLSPSTVTLITLRPHRAPILKIEMGVSKPTVYGGAAQDVLIALHNPDTKPLRAELILAGSHPGLVPAEVARLELGMLPPGSTKRLRYPLHVPTVGLDADMGVTAHVRVAASGKLQTAEEFCASITWKTLASLTAELETERADVTDPHAFGVIGVQLTNRTAAALTVTVDGGQGEISASLPPGRQPSLVPVRVAPAGTDPGLYPVVIRVGSKGAPLYADSPGVPLLALEAQVGVPVVSRRAATPPMIDGDLTEWQDATPISLGHEDQWHGRTWGGPEDLSAMAYTRWDEQNFYFACAVTQSTFTPPAAAEGWKRRDMVTFGFQGAETGAKADMEDRLSLALVGGNQPTLARDGVPISAQTGARVAIRRVGNHTYYEAAIPWSELKIAAHPNLMLKFAVTVTHGDGQASGTMEWGEHLNEEGRPHVYPPLKLEP